jgi:hypothetical protein
VRVRLIILKDYLDFKMIDNRKGMISIYYLIGGIIAIAVLVFFMVFLFTEGGSRIKFFEFLPDFKQEVKVVEGIERLRYDISTGEVSYYDGAKWIRFEGEGVKLGEKELDYSELKKDFEEFYYEGDRQGEIVVLGYGMVSILGLINANNRFIIGDEDIEFLRGLYGNDILSLRGTRIVVPEGIFIINGKRDDLGITLSNVDFKRVVGDIEFFLINSESQPTVAHFILGLDDKLSFGYYNNGQIVEEVSSYEKSPTLLKIFNGIKSWRDSVFENPVEIMYAIREIGDSGHHCAEVFDKKFIVVDLTKDVGKVGVCDVK